MRNRGTQARQPTFRVQRAQGRASATPADAAILASMGVDATVPSLPRGARVLLIKPSSLGDIVHALPVLAALRAARPDAHVAWLVGETFAPLLDGHPMIDELIRFDRARFGRMWRQPHVLADFVRFVRDLRRRRFDMAVDLQGLARSGFLALASGAPRRVGFADARESAWTCYNRRVRCDAAAVHAVDRNLCVARAIGLDVAEPRFALELSPLELESARELLRGAWSAPWGSPPESFVAVIPGARWETKLWSAERFAELIARLHEAGMPPCVLLGAPSDRPRAAAIMAAIGSGAACVDLVGRTTLRQMAALLALSACAVCLDSGPMHIAAALAKPLVALFGPTDSARTGPYSGGVATIRVLTSGVDCAPCLERKCRFSPQDSVRRLACMTRIQVDAVLAAVVAALDQSPRNTPETAARQARRAGPDCCQSARPA